MGGDFESAKTLEHWLNKQKQELQKEGINPYLGRSFLPITFITERLVYKEMEGLVEGRIVHFVLSTNLHKEKTPVCRAAIIVNAWGGTLEDGMVNLQIFLDGRNDDLLFAKSQMEDFLNIQKPLTVWATSVKYSETKEVGTWHWPERS